MAFPVFSLLSLICLLLWARFPHSNTAHPRFVPFRPVAVCRGSGKSVFALSDEEQLFRDLFEDETQREVVVESLKADCEVRTGRPPSL
jgi:hypothetical protein